MSDLPRRRPRLSVLRRLRSRPLRAPGHAAAVAGSVAIGVGVVAATAIFTGALGGAAPDVSVVPDPRSPLLSAADPVAAFQQAGVGVLLVVLVGATLGVAAVALLHAGLLGAARELGLRGELAVRAALGASPLRLVAARAREAVVLVGAGIAVGAAWGVPAGALLRSTWPAGFASDLPSAATAGWLLAGAAGIVAVPLMVAAVSGVVAGLRSGSGDAVRRGGLVPDPGGRVGRNLLAGTQLALSAGILVVGGSALRATLGDVGAGGSVGATGDTVAIRFELPGPGDVGTPSVTPGRLVAAGRELPGVAAAVAATPGAWFGLGPAGTVRTECGRCSEGGLFLPVKSPEVRQLAVGPGFFEVAGVDLVRGRVPEGADERAVAVVSEAYAAAHFEGGDPLGRRVQLGGSRGPWHRVVGVVEDVPPRGTGAGLLPPYAVYVPLRRARPRSFVVALRARDGAAGVGAVSEAARGWVETSGLSDAVAEISTLDARLAGLRAPDRWTGRVVFLLGLVAVLLSAAGLHAGMRRNVQSTRGELALRLALGAPPRGVVRLTLRRAGGVVAWGLAVGALAALEGMAQLRAALPDVRLADTPIVVGTAVVLVGAAALGAWGPAREAARTEPARALRGRP